MCDWPRSKGQWKPGRSAKELARHWTKTHSIGTVPPDYRNLLCPRFPGLTFHKGRPEHTTPLPPKGSSGPRTHDLLLRGRWKKGSLTVGVEAKADELFDETLEKAWEKAEKALKKRPSSRARQRLKELLEWVWRTRQRTDSLAKLHYQLLFALVGTAIQACIDSRREGEAGCGTGVLLIHVFETGKTRSKELEQNQRDLERFTRALPGVAIPAGGMAPGCLYGPATVNVGADFAPSGKATPAAVYLAIVRTKLR